MRDRFLNASSSLLLSAAGDMLAEPHTLAAVAAALATCRHPHVCRVSAFAASDPHASPSPLTWCGACGAMTTTLDPLDDSWIPAALVRLLSPDMAIELAMLLIGVRDLHQALERRVTVALAQVAEDALPDSLSIEAGSARDLTLGEIRIALAELASSRPVRDASRVLAALTGVKGGPPHTLS
jgi:hypothetical protein